ncbi:Zinc finger CCCH domain-containing protein 56 [Platanthera zijinensis]|uniref:Zinc finger CCCH domain-containing protein 56 n=1 Tax=Platanthera zijinensis TaxID=2320716 RepID=A0AAP0AYK3_9ASPA
MFFKTKSCSKLRSGTCPYLMNCSFAHRMEEPRRPPTNWPEIVAAAAVDRRGEEHQIPIPTSSAGMFDGQRSYKGKHCKKFYTDEGCSYGDICSFLHDEQSKDRVSGGSGSIQKHSNWKTRICNKWEMTGYCPFGTKCHFAHGAAELHSHRGRFAKMETNDTSSTAPDASIKVATAAISSITADPYHIGVPAQRSNTMINPRPIQRHTQKWKGPDKISRIYGDLIDDID